MSLFRQSWITAILFTVLKLLNPGWFVLVIILTAIIPAYLLGRIFAYWKWKKALRTPAIIANCCIVLSALLLPDFLDTPPASAFFMLWKDPPECLLMISGTLLMTAVVLDLVAFLKRSRPSE